MDSLPRRSTRDGESPQLGGCSPRRLPASWGPAGRVVPISGGYPPREATRLVGYRGTGSHPGSPYLGRLPASWSSAGRVVPRDGRLPAGWVVSPLGRLPASWGPAGRVVSPLGRLPASWGPAGRAVPETGGYPPRGVPRDG